MELIKIASVVGLIMFGVGFVLGLIVRGGNERELKKQIDYLERQCSILNQRVARLQDKRIFNSWRRKSS